jgi:hypothetical protein
MMKMESFVKRLQNPLLFFMTYSSPELELIEVTRRQA